VAGQRGSIRAEQWIISARGIATTFIGERVINHSKHVLEDTYDPWDHFDEKRDALERFETDLLQLRDNETTNVPAKRPKCLRLVAVHTRKHG
jgi:hypothetical protein